MFIKNWMRKKVLTISSEMNANSAMRLLEENKLPFIPVVDNGVLRGILTRRDIRGAASAVTATQNVHEMNFFNKQVKVRDLMVRKPLTVSMNDTIETALEIGSEMGGQPLIYFVTISLFSYFICSESLASSLQTERGICPCAG